MNYSEAQARRTAQRYAVDAFMPGVNDAIDTAYRAMVDASLTIREASDAMNATLGVPVMRAEAAAGLLEMSADQITKLIDDAGEEYAGVLASRVEAAAKRIRAHMLKDEP